MSKATIRRTKKRTNTSKQPPAAKPSHKPNHTHPSTPNQLSPATTPITIAFSPPARPPNLSLPVARRPLVPPRTKFPHLVSSLPEKRNPSMTAGTAPFS